jgi:hypothetical protein
MLCMYVKIIALTLFRQYSKKLIPKLSFLMFSIFTQNYILQRLNWSKKYRKWLLYICCRQLLNIVTYRYHFKATCNSYGACIILQSCMMHLHNCLLQDFIIYQNLLIDQFKTNNRGDLSDSSVVHSSIFLLS